MTTTDLLEFLAANCKASVSVGINDHRDYYEDAETAIEKINYLRECGDDDPIDAEIAAKMIELDSIVCVQFYPLTPIGFHRVYHYDLRTALEMAVEILKEPA